jgi:hypothetical protein
MEEKKISSKFGSLRIFIVTCLLPGEKPTDAFLLEKHQPSTMITKTGSTKYVPRKGLLTGGPV